MGRFSSAPKADKAPLPLETNASHLDRHEARFDTDDAPLDPNDEPLDPDESSDQDDESPVDTVFYSKSWKKISIDDFSPASPCPEISLISWNIDFMRPMVKARMTLALQYLRTQLKTTPGSKSSLRSTSLLPCCILLQEVDSDAFPTILADKWVRDNFFVVPGEWQGQSYGNVTLVSRNLRVVASSCLDFPTSTMGRNAIIVDLAVDSGSSRGNSSKRRIRIANVHLESLPDGSKNRVSQLKSTSQVLKAPEIALGLVAGDMNAIGDSDVKLPESFGLTDAWTGDEDAEVGFTWGWQPKSRFPPGRLDKICYHVATHEPIRVSSPIRIGVGLKHGAGWVSDHYGLMSTISLE
ncbi:Endonuclease/exonuclease/phosphatase [Mycena floridula]|nr:Endonuclease/exonuclease/phosphatase [Mycena floridula]